MSAEKSPCGCGPTPAPPPARSPGVFAGTGPQTDARTGLPAAFGTTGPAAGPPYHIPVRPLTTFYAAPPGGEEKFTGSCSDETTEPDRIIKFEFNAFIPKNLGAWLPQPWPLNGWDYETDRRGFGGGSSRVFAKGQIRSSEIGRVKRVPVTYGTSGSRRRTPAGRGLFRYQTMSGAVDGRTVTQSRRTKDGACETTVYLEAEAGYPFIKISQKINFYVVFSFTADGPNKVKVRASGHHNEFPYYEARVEHIPPTGGVLRGQLYEFTSWWNGPNPLSLTYDDYFVSKTASLNAATGCCAPQEPHSSRDEKRMWVPATKMVERIAP